MKKTQASTSAQGIAFARALETSKPANIRICNDPYARKFISSMFYLLGRLFAGYGERVAPGVLDYLAVRCRFIDDYLQQCINASIKQVVILGAGLDSRAYRFEAFKKRVKIFEVDHPATQQVKREKVIKIFGEIPSHVTLVPIDFESETLQKLYEYDYSNLVETLFILEGVVHYLQGTAIDQTLEFIRKNSSPGSTVIFDYMYTSALKTPQKRGEITRMDRTAKITGEKLIFGIEEGKAVEFLQARGYSQVVNYSSQDLERKYFTGVNKDRVIASIYAIVHATVGK